MNDDYFDCFTEVVLSAGFHYYKVAPFAFVINKCFEESVYNCKYSISTTVFIYIFVNFVSVFNISLDKILEHFLSFWYKMTFQAYLVLYLP